MNHTESRKGSQSGQIPLSGPGFLWRAARSDERARNPDDAFRLYHFADRAPVKGAAKEVLWALAHRCGYRDGKTRDPVTRAEFMSATGLSREGVRIGLARLRAGGYGGRVEKIKSEHEGSGEDTAHHYRIVIDPLLRAV